MSALIHLGQRARCRFGDKGDNALFVLIPHDPADFDWLTAAVTPERVARHLGGMPVNGVQCHPCPQLGAMVVAAQSILAGGVTASLALDAHGKSLAGYLLAMNVPAPRDRIAK